MSSDNGKSIKRAPNDITVKYEPATVFSGDEDSENKAPNETARRKRGRPRKSGELARGSAKLSELNKAKLKARAEIAFEPDLAEGRENVAPESTPPSVKRTRGRPRKSQARKPISAKAECVDGTKNVNEDSTGKTSPKSRVKRESPRRALQTRQSTMPTASAACTSSGYSSVSANFCLSRIRHDETTSASKTSNDVDAEEFKRTVIAKWNETRARLAEMARADERRQHELSKGRSSSSTNSNSSTSENSNSSMIDELYELSRKSELGEGHFGMVFSAVDRANRRPVAVKEIRKDRFPDASEGFYARLLQSEVAILQSLSHPTVIRLETVVETAHSLFIVLERMETDLFAVASLGDECWLSERLAKFFVAQVLHALAYLHARGIAHCDVKPENVLLAGVHTSQPQAKLCDFGFARFIAKKCQCAGTFGTPVYVAPEIMAGDRFDKSIDIWSLGILCFDILVGHLPFPAKERPTEESLQPRQLFRPKKHWARMEDAAKHFISKLIQLDPEQRPTVAECLAHDWLDDGQLYVDLRQLEARVGAGRYLTTAADDAHFIAERQCLDEYLAVGAQF